VRDAEVFHVEVFHPSPAGTRRRSQLIARSSQFVNRAKCIYPNLPLRFFLLSPSFGKETRAFRLFFAPQFPTSDVNIRKMLRII